VKVKVTHLKANGWPEGTKVGDIVDLPEHEAIPPWARGKCFEVGGAEPQVEAEPQTKAKPKK
jgi:hypothetical protein